jgi:hypothetical protein
MKIFPKNIWTIFGDRPGAVPGAGAEIFDKRLRNTGRWMWLTTQLCQRTETIDIIFRMY